MKRFLTGMVFLCGIAFSIHSQMETKEYSAIKECEQGKEQIVIKSTPEKALVYINNEYQGKTPLVIENLSPNYYNVSLRKKNYSDAVALIEVRPGYVVEYYFEMKEKEEETTQISD